MGVITGPMYTVFSLFRSTVQVYIWIITGSDHFMKASKQTKQEYIMKAVIVTAVAFFVLLYMLIVFNVFFYGLT